MTCPDVVPLMLTPRPRRHSRAPREIERDTGRGRPGAPPQRLVDAPGSDSPPPWYKATLYRVTWSIAMTKTALAVGIIALTSLGGVARGDEQPGGQAGSLAQACQFDVKGDRKDEWKRAPKADSSVTSHRLTAGGKSIDYTATAGTLVIRDDDDKPLADMGYIAYTRRDVKDAAARPLMFAFNGGPG